MSQRLRRSIIGLLVVGSLLIGNVAFVAAAPGGNFNQCTKSDNGQGHAYGLSKHCTP